MSDFYDEIGGQLRRAHQRITDTERQTSAPRRARRALVVPVLAASLLAGTAFAASQAWSPLLGDSQEDRPVAASSPVPVDQGAGLAVLRRAQTAADRGPDVRAQLKMLVGAEDHGIRLDGVRRLGDGIAPGSAVVLIPKESFGETSSAARKPVLRDALCVSYPNPPIGDGSRVSSASSCWSLKQIFAGKAYGLAPAGPSPTTSGMSFYGLVPDGVASVAITRPDGSTAKASVHDNFVRIADAGTPHDSAEVTGVRWLDSSGKDIAPSGSHASDR
jgi:hypothetical protein